MDERLETSINALREHFPEQVSEPLETFGQHSVEVSRSALVQVARFCRDEFDFQLLADWSAIDLLGLEPAPRRFLVSGHLASVKHPTRLRLRVYVPEGDETCPSLVDVWGTANAQEREMWDLFGIHFEGHPNLRRILMPDEWEGHPQRKDYPLGGVNVQFHGAFIPPPDVRQEGTTTTGYPGRTS